MARTPGAARGGGPGRQVLLGVSIGATVFLAVALFRLTFLVAGLCALPLAVLLGLSRPGTLAGRAALGVAVGLTVLWLVSAAEPPGYAMRAAAIWATAVFVILTMVTRWSLTGRALAGLGASILGLTASLPLFNLSWGELSWWAEHRLGMSARAMLGRFWAGLDAAGGTTGPARQQDVERLIQEGVRLTSAVFPALLAVLVLLGLVLAGRAYYRLAATPKGVPPAPFTEFRFTDHLGWLAIPPLVFLIIPRFVVLKPLAANVLVVLAALYGLRGIAVAVFFLPQVAGGGFLIWLLLGTIILLMLPAVLGGAIALGIIDAGLQLRTRWANTTRQSKVR